MIFNNIEPLLNITKQLKFLNKLSPFFGELEQISFDWDNCTFNHSDAALWYAVVRLLQPDNIIDIGCGQSTLIAIEAEKKNDKQTNHICIDINFNAVEDKTQVTSFIHSPVQDINKDLFLQLVKDDILFIDGSHLVEKNGDVTFLILQILPMLNSGVYIHFHDITLPEDYPDTQAWDGYAEQYLLLAFLLYNNKYEILAANRWLGENFKEELENRIPKMSDRMKLGGGSFWIKKL